MLLALLYVSSGGIEGMVVLIVTANLIFCEAIGRRQLIAGGRIEIIKEACSPCFRSMWTQENGEDERRKSLGVRDGY